MGVGSLTEWGAIVLFVKWSLNDTTFDYLNKQFCVIVIVFALNFLISDFLTSPKNLTGLSKQMYNIYVLKFQHKFILNINTKH